MEGAEKMEENMSGVDTYVTLSAGGYMETKTEKQKLLIWLKKN